MDGFFVAKFVKHSQLSSGPSDVPVEKPVAVARGNKRNTGA
jgi:hypothetical protein